MQQRRDFLSRENHNQPEIEEASSEEEEEERKDSENLEYHPDDFDPIKENFSRVRPKAPQRSQLNIDHVLLEKLKKSVILGQSRKNYSDQCTKQCKQTALVVTESLDDFREIFLSLGI